MARTPTTKTTAQAAKKTPARRPARSPRVTAAKPATKTAAITAGTLTARKSAPRAAVKSLPRKAPVKAVTKPVAAKAISSKLAKPANPVAAAQGKKVVPVKKQKLVRDSFSFPAHEHALLAELKKRALKLGKEFKKSEILRAGIAHLNSLADGALVMMLNKVERVKTGRPAKKGKKK